MRSAELCLGKLQLSPIAPVIITVLFWQADAPVQNRCRWFPPVIKMLLPVMFMVASWQLATRANIMTKPVHLN